jgi:hypothetical protein
MKCSKRFNKWISDKNLSVDFTFNLPICLHLTDGEYNVEFSEDGSLTLRLDKKSTRKL